MQEIVLIFIGHPICQLCRSIVRHFLTVPNTSFCFLGLLFSQQTLQNHSLQTSLSYMQTLRVDLPSCSMLYTMRRQLEFTLIERFLGMFVSIVFSPNYYPLACFEILSQILPKFYGYSRGRIVAQFSYTFPTMSFRGLFAQRTHL